MELKEFNISEGKENFSQRNNEVKPYESCNTTSLTMATTYIKELLERFLNSPYFKIYSRFNQWEDRLQQAILDWGLNPTIHNDLMNGYNRFMGAKIDTFSTSVPFKELIDDLLSGRPWVGSGTFPGFPFPEKKPLGHIVCVVGMVYETDPYKPEKIIIDDPYGDTMNNWKGSGDNVKIPWELFVSWMKPINNPSFFWAHRLKII